MKYSTSSALIAIFLALLVFILPFIFIWRFVAAGHAPTPNICPQFPDRSAVKIRGSDAIFVWYSAGYVSRKDTGTIYITSCEQLIKP